ncbi:dienelactone hydrolase family protein [Emcibacter sp. SYSU 3D8]|uniref:dienelactone hydrolase family protein n=1 Tax=Emcibacter sp. SYSU 3D8 TaxID=3133969 RepID=UPI0031FE4592
MGSDQLDGRPSRRDLLKTAAALPLAAVLANPALAGMAAATTAQQTLKTHVLGKQVTASLAVPAVTPAPALIVIHEFWGLNDYIRSMAVEFSKLGFLALAIDLYGGKVGSTQKEASGYMSQVKPDEATDTLVSWARWLAAHKQSTGRVGSVGWCFGGGWSMETGIEAGTDATVVYYGKVDQPVERLKKLRGPILGHFASRDAFINPAMVNGFETNMTAAGKDAIVYRYEADHAFANPTSARYDEADARLAWERTTSFLGEVLFAPKG